MKKIIICFVLLTIFTACKFRKEVSDKEIDNGKLYLLIGSYSDGSTPGISVYDFETQTGNFTPVSELSGILNPSYLAISSDEKYIYSVNETNEGGVSSFSFDKESGRLSFINSQATEGADPCYITVDRNNTSLLTANYNGGNISLFPLNENGSIKALSQELSFSPDSHIHTVVFSPDGKFLLATDLGKDKIYIYRVQHYLNGIRLPEKPEEITIVEHGSGPRHLAFHPKKKMLYCINELSGKISVFNYDSEILSAVQSIASDTTPGKGDKSSADIHLTPDGRFLYASNRLEADGIAIFSVHPETGLLTRIGYQETGLHPRNFTISPNGKYLLCANRDSHHVQIFEINSQSGLLHDTGKEITVDKPVCLKWVKKK